MTWECGARLVPTAPTSSVSPPVPRRVASPHQFLSYLRVNVARTTRACDVLQFCDL